MLNSKTCFTGNADNHFHYFLQKGPIQVKLWEGNVSDAPPPKMPRLSCFLAKNSKKKSRLRRDLRFLDKKNKKMGLWRKKPSISIFITFFGYSPKIEVYIRE